MAEAAEARARGAHPTRYTLCGEAPAEARVAQDLARLSTGIDSELGDQLRGLLLTGAFARAEGAIVDRDGEPQAATPGYELLALMRRPERFEARMRALSAAWSQLLRTRVTIRAFAPAELARVEATRFWYCAGRGWVITLVGDPALALAIPRREPRELRWQESAIALCEGLQGLALANLESASEPVAMQALQRAVLACVDGVLLRRGQYADTLAGRAEALVASHASAALRAAYRDAIVWSGRPDRFWPEHGDFEGWRAATRRALTHALLAAEAERLQGTRDLLVFARLRAPLFRGPAVPTSPVARLLRTLPRFAAQRDAPLEPIERLLRASAVLALGSHAPDQRECAGELLRVGADASDGRMAAALRELARAALRATRFEHPFGEVELELT
jgi:hypothetical protein